jgi:hypothetical protein
VKQFIEFWKDVNELSNEVHEQNFLLRILTDNKILMP